MPTRHLNTVIQHLRTTMLEHDGAGMTDGQLLDCFVSRREEAALEALVHRLAPMVWGVCRRLLHDHHDAEDAFQATFLVLLRKATCIAPKEMVGNWLYGVAHQTALKARATTAKRRAREKQKDMPEPEAPQHDLWPDLPPLLDQELSRLPDQYRVVIVLCELEGQTRKEAARQLGWPEGTVAGRLARARELLARRLSRRGVAVTGSVLASVLTRHAAAAAVPIPVVSSTIKAVTSVAAGQAAAGLISTEVAALTAGATKAMLLSKLKFTAAVLLTAGLVCGAGVFMHQALADKPAAQAGKEKPADQGKEQLTELTGVVQSVDAGKNTLTLTGKPIGTRTFDVARDARVILDDGTGSRLGFKDGKLTDIAEGFTVTVRLSEDGNRVVGIWAEGPTVRGEVKAVAAEKRTISVMIAGGKNEAAQEKTFEVAPRVAVVIHDGKAKGKIPAEASKLADVPVGALVTLKLAADRKVVASIQAEGQEVHGFIKVVDGDKNAIIISVGGDKDKTFSVPATAYIAMHDGKQKGKQPPQAYKLTDVPVGAQVILKLTLDQKGVVSLSVQEASMSGTVKAVDAGKNSLTLATSGKKGEPAEEKTFDVAKDAAVRIDGKEGKLADLPVEAVVNVKLHADRKTVGSIQAEGPSTSGVVKAVDVAQGSITLAAGKGGEDRTLAVIKDAPIFIDGKAGKLADVVVEALVTGKLSADQKGFVSLHVSGPSVQGVVKEVDVVKGKITATVVVGKNDSADKVFDLAKNVVVTKGSGKISTPIKLADVKAGQEVVLQLSADQKTVVGIRVSGE